jgi:uridylate kinase
MTKQYSRVMLKLSGEQLAGTKETGIDPEFVGKLASEIKKVVDAGLEMVIVVGGGNFIRGATFAGHGIDRASADYMGMLSTILNGMALTDMLEHEGIATRLQTSIEMKQITEPFIRRRALRHLEKGRVVVLSGGIGKPYMTTDTAAVTFALELNCEVVLKATNVDGVYDRDPNKYSDAIRYDTVSFQEAIENPEIKVMDKAALGLALEQNKPIVVFDINKQDNLARITQGETQLGTLVS